MTHLPTTMADYARKIWTYLVPRWRPTSVSGCNVCSSSPWLALFSGVCILYTIRPPNFFDELLSGRRKCLRRLHRAVFGHSRDSRLLGNGRQIHDRSPCSSTCFYRLLLLLLLPPTFFKLCNHRSLGNTGFIASCLWFFLSYVRCLNCIASQLADGI